MQKVKKSGVETGIQSKVKVRVDSAVKRGAKTGIFLERGEEMA